MASAVARFALKSGGAGILKTGAGGLAGGALFLGLFDDVFNFIEENPLIPIGIGGVVLFIILRMKS